MTVTPSLATLDALPGDAMLPVRWIRELVAGIDRIGGTDALGLTVHEVAERYDRAPSTVRSWCAQGLLPGARRLRGREWRIPASALQALLDEGGSPPKVESVERLAVPHGGLRAWRHAP